MRCRLTAGVLSGAFVFLRRIGIRSIGTFILTRILSEATNKTPMIMTILKENQFFLTNKMIYIMCIRKLHNFPKQIGADR